VPQRVVPSGQGLAQQEPPWHTSPEGQEVVVQLRHPLVCKAQVCSLPVALHWVAPAVQALVQLGTQAPREQIWLVGQVLAPHP
jgi:hypothetical protein